MNQKIRKFVTVGMLIAVEIILGRLLTIALPTVTINFSFLPLAIIAILYGPAYSIPAAAICDILIALLGSYGYFPPMTVSAILTGAIYGVFFYRKPAGLLRVSIVVLCESVFVSLLLQTYWLTMLTGKGYIALLPARVIQNLITCPLQIVCIRFVGFRIARLVGGNAYSIREKK